MTFLNFEVYFLILPESSSNTVKSCRGLGRGGTCKLLTMQWTFEVENRFCKKDNIKFR